MPETPSYPSSPIVDAQELLAHAFHAVHVSGAAGMKVPAEQAMDLWDQLPLEDKIAYRSMARVILRNLLPLLS